MSDPLDVVEGYLAADEPPGRDEEIAVLAHIIFDACPALNKQHGYTEVEAQCERAARVIVGEQCLCRAGPPDEFGNRDQIVTPRCPTCADGPVWRPYDASRSGA